MRQRLHLLSRAGGAPVRVLAILSLAWLAACSGNRGGGSAGSGAAAPPATSGTVWEIRNPDDRTSVAGSIVAFVNGVHVMVIDGDRIYAGMTELAAGSGGDGARTMTFPSGLSASLRPSAQGVELQFGSGERVMVAEQAAPAGGEE